MSQINKYFFQYQSQNYRVGGHIFYFQHNLLRCCKKTNMHEMWIKIRNPLTKLKKRKRKKMQKK